MPVVPSLPNLEKLEEPPASLSEVPNYLFRSFSPASASPSSQSSIGPMAEPTPLGPYTADVLACHLSWEKHMASEFVSWTDSLLVALVYGIRKAEHQDWSDRGVRVCLAILDTSTVTDDVPIYPVCDMLDAFDFPTSEYWRRSKFAHEFLAHGRIENISSRGIRCYSVASVNDMIHKGIYEVYEPFRNPDRRLWARMQEIRDKIDSKPDCLTSVDMIRITRLIKCFDVDFRLPAALALIAISPTKMHTLMLVRCLKRSWLSGLSVSWAFNTNPPFPCPDSLFDGCDEASRFQAFLHSFFVLDRLEALGGDETISSDLGDMSLQDDNYVHSKNMHHAVVPSSCIHNFRSLAISANEHISPGGIACLLQDAIKFDNLPTSSENGMQEDPTVVVDQDARNKVVSILRSVASAFDKLASAVEECSIVSRA